MTIRTCLVGLTLITSGCCNDRLAAFSADDMCIALPPDDDSDTSSETTAEPEGSTTHEATTSNGWSETSDSSPTTSESSGTTASGNCCDQFGFQEGTDPEGNIVIKDGICGSSIPNMNAFPGVCVDCEFQPVLCMTHGCVKIGEQDCCLNAAGQTAPCMPG